MVQEITGSKTRIDKIPTSRDPKVTTASTASVKRLLGWEATTSLMEGLKKQHLSLAQELVPTFKSKLVFFKNLFGKTLTCFLSLESSMFACEFIAYKWKPFLNFRLSGNRKDGGNSIPVNQITFDKSADCQSQ
ncbi:MAG: hypothetical protein Ct9H90mP5_09530 [Acidimicrobiaceae bacterium]|nr:MAG: hypothetical protein Ct9H90mP5_09530 [Acidimicrobiaceae bacterium]